MLPIARPVPRTETLRGIPMPTPESGALCDALDAWREVLLRHDIMRLNDMTAARVTLLRRHALAVFDPRYLD